MKKVGDSIPQFSLQDTTGKKFDLNRPAKPTIIALFKVGCPTCQYTFPFLERLHKLSHDLQVIGISQDNAADTKDFAKRYGITFPLLLDHDGYKVSKAFGITIVPSLFLVAAGDKIVQIAEGWVKAEFQALAGNAPPGLFKAGESVAEFKAG